MRPCALQKWRMRSECRQRKGSVRWRTEMAHDTEWSVNGKSYTLVHVRAMLDTLTACGYDAPSE
ncbi:hypothetical protein KI387_007566, partial [Taxus chinensis]